MAVVTMHDGGSGPVSSGQNSLVQFGEIISSERDLSPEDQDLLADIRRRKLQLIQEILMLRNEIAEVNAEMERMDYTEDDEDEDGGGSRISKNNQKANKLLIGRKKFNMDPKRGIEFLLENHVLQSNSDDVSQFLFKGEGLNKSAIGEYLGEKIDFNLEVLDKFLILHEFQDMIIVQALRQFLWSFRLPGEAQKIDRMMEAFAKRYCDCNTGVFSKVDTCYILAFAVIMLNTSLHNPNVKDKPTVDQFVSMNRGIDDGADMPRPLLVSIYDSIKKEQFKIPEDDGNDLVHTFFNPDKEGWLWKQGSSRYRNWKRRWFILNDNCLYYFEYTTDKEPRGIIPLENLQVRDIADNKKPNCFELYPLSGTFKIKACKTADDGRVIEGTHSVYRVSAASPEDKQEWMKCIAKSLHQNPYIDIVDSSSSK